MNARGAIDFRWWFLPSWLGLDAPCVVTTWCLAIAATNELPRWPTAVGALFLVVWLIYLADRMIDVSRCKDWSDVSGRMAFGRRYRWLFIVCISMCAVALAAVFVMGLPVDVLWRGAFVSGGMAVYFGLFVVPAVFRGKLPGKEFGVGLFFALGCYCVLGMEGRTAPMFVGVAIVVAYNCLVIAARDHDVDRTTDPGGASSWWRSIDRDLMVIGVVLTAGAVVLIAVGMDWMFFTSLAIAFLLLLVLHRRAANLSGDAVRALADFCLLTPWPMIVIQLWKS